MIDTLQLVLSLINLQSKRSTYIFIFTLAACAALSCLQFQFIDLTRDFGVLIGASKSQSSDPVNFFDGIIKLLFISVIISIIQLLICYLSSKWAVSLARHVSISLLKGYIYSPYSFISTLSVSSEISTCVTQLNQVVTGIAFQVFPLINAFLSIFAILISVICSLGRSSIIVLALACLPGLIYSNLIKSRLKLISRTYADLAPRELYIAKSVLESKGEIDMLGVGHKFLDSYSSTISDIRLSQGNARFYDQLLKPITEGSLAFTAATLLIIVCFTLGASSVKPLVAQSLVYLVSFSKLLPASAVISKSLNSLRTCNAPLRQVLDRLKSLVAYGEASRAIASRKDTKKQCNTTSPRQYSRIENISMLKIRRLNYSIGHRIYNVKDLVLTPGAGFYCLTGESGVGKTSFLNAICSLTTSKYFDIEVRFIDTDDQTYRQNKNNKRHESIKEIIGYSFQHPYIFEGKSLLYNITLCENLTEVDMAHLSNTVALSGLATFTGSIEELGDTYLGDHGINLSGGQLKKLGLARAVYFSRGIILLDECTSGLDHDSEDAIIQSLKLLSNKYIIIASTHSRRVVAAAGKNLSVKSCFDNVFTIGYV